MSPEANETTPDPLDEYFAEYLRAIDNDATLNQLRDLQHQLRQKLVADLTNDQSRLIDLDDRLRQFFDDHTQLNKVTDEFRVLPDATIGLPPTDSDQANHAAEIANEIERSLDILETPARNIEPRHRSMRAVFDHSWELLSERERQIFAWLSVFRGGFASAAAEQVAGATLADLAGLVEKSLLQLDATGRFGIHELLRQYGTMQLATRQETDAAFAAHSGFYATLMRHHEASLKSPQQLETMQAIELDFENYRQGWEWALAKQHSANLHTMMHGLYLFGFLGSRHVDTIHMFQQTLAQPIADERLLGRLLARRWGSLHWWFQAETDYREAFAAIERALAIAKEAIQMHGAIGYTDEHDIGLFVRRAIKLAAWLGNGAQHRKRYAALSPALEQV